MSMNIQPGWQSSDTRSSLHSLDAAWEYLRNHGSRVFLGYLVAMLPFSAAILYIIDIVSSQSRSSLANGCMLLTAATGWRWLWLSRVQRRVQEDLKGEPPLS